MNLWLRLIWLLISAGWRARLTLPSDASQVQFRVWPHDLDVSFHLNNGRYLTLMDLGRTDVMVRSGLWRAVLQNKWTPIASAITIRYRRELRLFQPFRLESRILCWDETLVVMEQQFVMAGGQRDGQVAARALFKGGIYDRAARRFVPMSELMATIGAEAQSPAPSAEVEAFLHADDQLKQTGQARP